MRYIDGFLIVVAKRNLRAYAAISKKAGRVWKEHGALEYRECVGEDLASAIGIPFARRAGAKPSETVVFSWIVYKSRAHRDRVNAKIMKDSRIAKMMTGKSPFDPERMSYGGFEVMVDM